MTTKKRKVPEDFPDYYMSMPEDFSKYDMSFFNGDFENDKIDDIDQFDQNEFNNFTPIRNDSFVFSFDDENDYPKPMQRLLSYQLDSEIRDKQSEIVTFSMPIENDLSFYMISKLMNTDPVTDIVSVYSGNFTLETPDLCLCLSNATIGTLPSDFATPSGERFFLPEPITMYNICYKQFYLFSRIFKKIVNCGGKCITNPSFDRGKVLNFTQSSYCCGYYSAVAAVMYRYYQQHVNFPGKSETIDFSSITMAEINNFVDSFESANASSVLIKLFNLAISYTSYFSNYIFKNPLQDVTTNFLRTTNQNCQFNYTTGTIQLASIYATTDMATTTYHHFCTYNLGDYILISDAWAAGSSRRPLWTRFTPATDFAYVINMLENNTTGLSPEQLEIIKLFFLQPHGSTFLPIIKICYIVIDFVIDGKILKYSDGRAMPGFNDLTYVLGGTKRKKRRIRTRTKNKKLNI